MRRMANLDVMYSSKTDQWATPADFFNELDREFHFDLDPCADEHNHKCERYFTEAQNGLTQDWGGAPRVLQSSLRKGYQRLGSEVLRRISQRKHNRGAAYPCQNRHKIFSRLHPASV